MAPPTWRIWGGDDQRDRVPPAGMLLGALAPRRALAGGVLLGSRWCSRSARSGSIGAQRACPQIALRLKGSEPRGPADGGRWRPGLGSILRSLAMTTTYDRQLRSPATSPSASMPTRPATHRPDKLDRAERSRRRRSPPMSVDERVALRRRSREFEARDGDRLGTSRADAGQAAQQAGKRARREDRPAWPAAGVTCRSICGAPSPMSRSSRRQPQNAAA